jgi:glutamate-ammonia-ligase adenylyltransferase
MNVPTPQLEQLPDLLRPQVREWLDGYPAQASLPAAAAIRETLSHVWACSEFIARSCLQHPELLAELEADGTLENVDAPGAMRERLHQRLAEVSDADRLARVLRRFRLREMVRIAWRDLAGWADLEESLLDLSRLAEVCIDEALARLYEWQCKAWGTPRNEAGEAQRLVVLGMGKLGGEELNFSSDIDLIFTYPEAGETDAARPKSNEEFFTALGRKLIAALDAHAADGQVFRVDMRLRPYGTSGPLAMSFNGMEAYYQNQGREWERYAMIKARVVGGDYAAGEALLKTLQPFVYRRYIDFGALESLREMKGMIAREVKRRGMEDNIKLGRGGIREIEFTGQAFQLIRGGRDPELRCRRILPVLRHLAEDGQLPRFVADELIEAYGFLRRSENRLQAMADSQTHELPTGEVERARLALAMGFADWDGYLKVLDGWRRRVQEHFDQVFTAPQAEAGAAESEHAEVGDVWLSEPTDEQARALLGDAGFADPAQLWHRLNAFRHSNACRALSANGRRRLDHLMPLLLAAASGNARPDDATIRLLDLVEAIARRTSYLALLVENPMALSQLVQLCAASPWIARYLARHPILLDELLDPRSLYVPLGRAALTEELNQRLRGVPADDLEQQMEVLRQFKQANTLRVAAADITGAVPLMVVSDYLTYLAETTVEAVLRLAYQQMSKRYGAPQLPARPEEPTPGIAIVAYGKLGGIELGYGSDLDLVFLHEAGEEAADAQMFFGRVTQRVIHILSTTTPGGMLYEADTRLRPSGKGGLLSTTLPAFADYQRTNAWTWEHQALTRARVVVGDARLAEGFEAVRREILARRRDSNVLRKEVRDMRRRQFMEKGSKDPAIFDLKSDRGGIADIEFMVQYGVLSRAAEHSGLLRYPDNIRLLDELSHTGWISADEARLLADAYRAFRARLHKLTLQEEPARVPASEFAELRASVTELWQRLMED